MAHKVFVDPILGRPRIKDESIKETVEKHYRAHGGSAGGDAVYPQLYISRGAVITDPTGVIDVMCWDAPYSCTVQNVFVFATGTTGLTINAQRYMADTTLDDLLPADYEVQAVDTWENASTVQNVDFNAGDGLYVNIRSLSGAPTQVAIQVTFTTAGSTTVNPSTPVYFAGPGRVNISDSDFSVTPSNGTTGTAFNTSDGKTYYCTRSNDTWKAVEAT